MKNTLHLLFVCCLTLSAAAQQVVKLDVLSPNYSAQGWKSLKAQIGAANIVLLGEHSHYEAEEFTTKIEIIKFLIQELQFDIIAFESGLFELSIADSIIAREDDVQTVLDKAFFAQVRIK